MLVATEPPDDATEGQVYYNPSLNQILMLAGGQWDSIVRPLVPLAVVECLTCGGRETGSSTCSRCGTSLTISALRVLTADNLEVDRLVGGA